MESLTVLSVQQTLLRTAVREEGDNRRSSIGCLEVVESLSRYYWQNENSRSVLAAFRFCILSNKYDSVANHMQPVFIQIIKFQVQFSSFSRSHWLNGDIHVSFRFHEVHNLYITWLNKSPSPQPKPIEDTYKPGSLFPGRLRWDVDCVCLLEASLLAGSLL